MTDLNASIRPFILQDLWLAELTRLADTGQPIGAKGRSDSWSQFLTGESG